MNYQDIAKTTLSNIQDEAKGFLVEQMAKIYRSKNPTADDLMSAWRWCFVAFPDLVREYDEEDLDADRFKLCVELAAEWVKEETA